KAKLTNQEKEMIRMYRIQGKTIKEIAQMYSCSVGLIHKIINE
ncbi:sigma factor-like helix-turn-helix DNA-binding protein, partial [Clostridium paraputrificum]